MPTSLDDLWGPGGSPACHLLFQKYKSAGLHKWDNERTARLCRMIPCTLEELAASAFIDKNHAHKYWALNRWPRPAALIFAWTESWVILRRFGYQRPPSKQAQFVQELVERGEQPHD